MLQRLREMVHNQRVLLSSRVENATIHIGTKEGNMLSEQESYNTMFNQPLICNECGSQGTPEKPLVFIWKTKKWYCRDHKEVQSNGDN